MADIPTKISILNSDYIKVYEPLLYDIGIHTIEGFRHIVYTANGKNSGKKKRIYIIELHYSCGFAMVKFYPKKLKNSPKKYEIRVGDKNYHTLSVIEIKSLFVACVKLMKDYLKNNPNNLIGYFGQPDERDHNNINRLNSQRSSVYNIVVDNLFRTPSYILNEREQFGEINCRYIQNGIGVDEKMIGKNQDNFLNMILYLSDLHPKMMTKSTKLKYYGKEIF